jgi:hypothetical protein
MTPEQAKADMEKQIAAAQKAFTEKAERVGLNKVAFITNAALRVEGNAKRAMQDATVDTSISYGKRKHHPSVPGSAPASDSGDMIRSITHTVAIDGESIRARVGSTMRNPDYPKFLEDGTSKMAPRPWLLPSFDKMKTWFRANKKRVFGNQPVTVEIGDGE